MSNKVPDIKGMVDEPGKGMIQVQQPQQLTLALIESFFGSVGGQSLSNFVGPERESWQFTAMCQSSQVMSADDLKGAAFPVKYFYTHRVKIAGDTPGEYSDALRVVLVSPDGLMVSFTSDGIARSLVGLITAFGMKPWDPPVDVKVDVIKTRKGWRAYTLIPSV